MDEIDVKSVDHSFKFKPGDILFDATPNVELYFIVLKLKIGPYGMKSYMVQSIYSGEQGELETYIVNQYMVLAA